MQYQMSVALKSKVKTAIDNLAKLGIKGGVYHYKGDECSCCFGLGDGYDFEINDNIPGNWGIYGSKDPRDAYHKINYKLTLKQATQLVKEFRKVLRGSGWKVEWGGSINHAVIINQPKAI